MMRVVPGRDMGLALPWWYGYAWRRYNLRADVFIVIPFNFAVALLRQWWLRLCVGPRNKLERGLLAASQADRNDAWRLGYEDGKRDGEKAAKNAMAASIRIFTERKPEREYPKGTRWRTVDLLGPNEEEPPQKEEP